MSEVNSFNTEKPIFRVPVDVCSFLDDTETIIPLDLTRRAAQEILEFNKIRDTKQKDRLTSE